jgi:SAM-dependent methyltransferase
VTPASPPPSADRVFDYESKVWGEQECSTEPSSLGALRLRYCLEDLAGTRGTVLELGCGAGSFARALARHRPDLRYVGLDISARSLARARARGAKRVALGDVQEHPLRDASVDAVAFFDVLEHVERPDLLLREAARVLRPGGRVHGFVPCEGSLYTLHGLASRLGYSPKERYAGHIQRFTADDLRHAIERAGLRVERWRWSGHLFTQLVDLGYFSMLAARGRNVDTTLECVVARGKRPWTRALGWAVKAVALLGYAESRFLRAVPASGVHVTCVKP